MTLQNGKPVVIIQARMASTRLPGKMMMELAGKKLMDWVVDSAKAINNAQAVVVATTVNEEDSPLAEHVRQLGVNCYRGSSEDVLDRFYNAALGYGADPIIRLCGDSPLVSSEYMDRMIEHHIKRASDLTHADAAAPPGTAGEVISSAALKTMRDNAERGYQREHVTPYIHENPGRFKIATLDAPDWLQGTHRLTIDEAADFRMFQMLFKELQDKKLRCDTKNGLSILNERPDIAEINRAVIQKDWRNEK